MLAASKRTPFVPSACYLRVVVVFVVADYRSSYEGPERSHYLFALQKGNPLRKARASPQYAFFEMSALRAADNLRLFVRSSLFTSQIYKVVCHDFF